MLDKVAENAAKLCEAIDGVIFALKRQHPGCGGIRDSASASRGNLAIRTRLPAGRAVIDRQTVHIHDIEAEIDTEYPDIGSLSKLLVLEPCLVLRC